jgi:hypothetical protein
MQNLFIKKNYDYLIVRISILYDLIRTRGKVVKENIILLVNNLLLLGILQITGKYEKRESFGSFFPFYLSNFFL